MTDRRDGWGVGSYRLATIIGWLFLAGMYYLVRIDHIGWAALCGLAAGGNFYKASDRANGKRIAEYEQRLQKLVGR